MSRISRKILVVATCAIALAGTPARSQEITTGTEITSAPETFSPLSEGQPVKESPETSTINTLTQLETETVGKPATEPADIATTAGVSVPADDVLSSQPVTQADGPPDQATSPTALLPNDTSTTTSGNRHRESAGTADTGTSVSVSDGVMYQVIRPGSGAEAPTTSTKLIHYTLYLADGTKVESSRDALFPVPFEFTVGQGNAIKGMELGTSNMRIGEVRKIYVPAAAGYGEEGLGEKVPPDTDLLFDVELVNVD